MIPEEVAVTDYTGVQLASGQRQAETAFASWRIGKAPSTSLTSGLSLSTRSSDIDLKEFLVQRGEEGREEGRGGKKGGREVWGGKSQGGME